jgi:mannose-1-phosphate guanylyltransferase
MTTSENHERAAVILAGGDGSRLYPLTRKITGQDFPKQFCPILGETTLVEQTLVRVGLTVAADRTLIVVRTDHQRFYEPLLANVPARRMVVQTENRGTAPAILYALLRLTNATPDAIVGIFPSDHYVSDDAAFMRHVELAFKSVSAWPDLTVVLGIVPDGPESSYGWIEPAHPFVVEDSVLLRVNRFLEKPSPEDAFRLWSKGWLWNSFVLVSRITTLQLMIRRALPQLYSSFTSLISFLDTFQESSAAEALYKQLPSLNFSGQILERSSAELALLPASEVEWSDLGESHRVMAALQRLGIRPAWAA